ncbi:MAG: class GN sortase [Hyphomicrobiales bacterium]|nr:MAG: class GN sortase [Hyphomicrobiales bacterium]
MAGIVAASALAGLVLIGEGVFIKAKAALAQVLLDDAFERSKRDGMPVRAWPWADTWPVARLTVPRLKRSAIVLSGGNGEALAFGPGHLLNTAEVGEDGTAVFAAHRDTHFAFLADVRPDDVIEVERGDGHRFRYRVTGSRVVKWNASGIDAAAEGSHLALSTCWPIGALGPGDERLVVDAELDPTVTATVANP